MLFFSEGGEEALEELFVLLKFGDALLLGSDGGLHVLDLYLVDSLRDGHGTHTDIDVTSSGGVGDLVVDLVTILLQFFAQKRAKRGRNDTLLFCCLPFLCKNV